MLGRLLARQVLGRRCFSSNVSSSRIDKLLIANRGEIACRVMKTAKKMGIKTVAVYSDADKNARHTHLADEAYHIGPAPSNQSYLRGDAILDVARRAGAHAVHPGYGFLSENTHFAQSCDEAGVIFVGPPASAILSMGDKKESKVIMEAAGVPVVPGYHGDDQSPALLLDEAKKAGFPVLIKATAGGGGKGMRIVHSAKEFPEALQAAQREAAAAFGNDKVIIEKFLVRPRHVEVQVFADQHGTCVALPERDCSIQRRYQKVVEEAPGPGLSQEQRHALGNSAADAARAVNYVGAGTVEFIMDAQGQFYFMEMNTRLQVEHPVTEMVTGLDLVEWQLKVAQGERLPADLHLMPAKGWSMEARVYAEAPRKGFLPGAGHLHVLRSPTSDDEKVLRVETGVRQGDDVTTFYDPMIAKLVVWGEDRDTAARRLSNALEQYRIIGLSHNIEFLNKCVQHPSFMNADVHTGFIEEHQDSLLAPPTNEPHKFAAAAAAVWITSKAAENKQAASTSADSNSPWLSIGPWQNVLGARTQLQFTDEFGNAISLSVSFNKDGTVHAETEEGNFDLDVSSGSGGVRIIAGDGASSSMDVIEHGDSLHVFSHGAHLQLKRKSFGEDDDTGASSSRIVSPMTGKVVQVKVQPGDEVQAGQVLVVMEAMKMEHALTAGMDGKVKAVHCSDEDQVGDGKLLVEMEE